VRRDFRGKAVLVKVLNAGFEYDGRTFGSLSAIANEVTGTIRFVMPSFGPEPSTGRHLRRAQSETKTRVDRQHIRQRVNSRITGGF
jgi:hypothetical protein